MGLIYLARSKVTGKGYVGKTTKTLKERKMSHGQVAYEGKTYFHKAIKKYGIRDFEWTVLLENIPDDELDAFEILMIKKHKTLVPNGYNLTEGGDGMSFPSEITRLKMSDGVLRKCQDPAHIAKLSASAKARDPSTRFSETRSSTLKKVWKDPQRKAAMVRAVKASMTEERNCKISVSTSKGITEKWKDPEYRAKQDIARSNSNQARSAAMKARWEDPKQRTEWLTVHGNTKLTEVDIIKIRKLHPIFTYKDLACRYGISPGHVKNIVKRRVWKHVP